MNKVEALNALEVIESSFGLGELEYVLAANTPENKEIMLSAGFTAEEIAHANDGDESDIDLSTLAFNYSDANCWSKEHGFHKCGEESQ